MITLYVHGEPLTLAGLYEHVVLIPIENYTIEREDEVLILSFQESDEEIFTTSLADAVLNYTANTVEREMVQEIIYHEYADMFGSDEAWLVSQVQKHLHGKKYYQAMHEDLVEILKDDGSSERNFDVTGFLTFRLKDRVMEVYDKVLEVVENFLIASEDIQFAKVLNRLVSIQVPKFELLDLIAINDGEDYEIIIDGSTRVDRNDLAGLLTELTAGNEMYELTSDDVILGTILTLSPRRIVVHHTEPNTSALVELLTHVYDGRISFCNTSCDLCKLFQSPE